MPIAVATIDELDPTLVTQTQAELTQLIRERHPEVDLSRGILATLLGYFAGGIAGGVDQTQIKRVQLGNSLLALNKNPESADPELADGVLSNWGAQRKTGVAAVGSVTIVLSSPAGAVISGNAVFTANSVNFQPTGVFTARPPGSTGLAANERALQPLGDGTYSFSIPLVATTPGVAGNIRRGVKMLPASIPGAYVMSYATSDFTSGSDTEINAELITRLQEGLSVQAWGGRTNILALLRAQPAFANTLAYSIIGYGNPEMSRDQHSIVPIGNGGRLDLYARTQGGPQTVALVKTATLVAKGAAGSTWQFAIGKDDAPGFYEVVQILKPADDPTMGGFAVTADIRGFDLSGDGVLPDVVTAVEAAYTRYQTAVIRFLDTETDVSELVVGSSTATYHVAVSGMPLVAELQTFVCGHEDRYLSGDTLVKAAVPCWLTLNFTIQQAAGETSPDLDAIRNRLTSLVNGLGFPGQLNASLIAETVHSFLTTRQALGPIEMQGRIRRPDGRTVYVRDKSILKIPADPGNMISGQTAIIILDPASIGVSVVTEGFSVSN